ncbi:hypothetical protein MRQ36_10155 [Micromonospora sp. R77]|uniref:hypothetical protein n=1 Tax=Micromonospora sp. R77 TaxID=2925836 RepID=UPI001F6204F9|nr:hypothetical protein [Micromonospora sp. R77]MCI4062915.1 hypothetical protein [Micromonospora sp. R77]
MVVLLSCALPAVLLVGLVGDAAGRSATGDDAATAAARRLGTRITAQLDRQAAALLGGDRAGFLAVAEPAARAGLTRRYAALRALRVTVWRPAADEAPTRWPADRGSGSCRSAWATASSCRSARRPRW